uniref:Retrovirus-related Pol polyprotein from transposon TNT 1-94 n=1 Tax=Cajanus cajan TaxID=3821 RepID=A0A151UDX4_CAJCA
MKIFMESVHRNIWQVMVTKYKIPTKIENGKEIEKPFDSWDQGEIKRAENDAKALNIIHSALNSDEFFRISACTTAKDAWDLIQVTHEGTLEVRRARKNTLIQEYETFKMTQGETIMDMQKRFTHIINHLKGLGKIFDEEEVNVKVLKSLNRRWKPTVTTITESKNLAQMTSAELFGKLREYKIDITRMVEEEQKDKKINSLALKLENSSSEEEDNSNEDKSKQEELNLMEKKPKLISTKKKAYIAWEENDSTTSSETDSEQKENLCLMANHETDYEVSDSDSSIYSYNQLYDVFCDLYKEARKLISQKRKLKRNTKEMELKIFFLEKDIHFLKSEIEIAMFRMQELMDSFDHGVDQ